MGGYHRGDGGEGQRARVVRRFGKLAVLAALHLDASRAWWQTLFLVAGIFLGAMLWWIILASLAGHYRDRFDDRAMVWMNRIAGLAIGGFGVVTLSLSLLR